jgi:hypothetical protein
MELRTGRPVKGAARPPGRVAQAASVEENIPKVGPTGQAKSTDFFSFQNAENLGDIVARKKLKKVLLF